MKNLLIMMSGCLLLLSCSKKSAIERDRIFPVISLLTPVDGDVFSNGQAIHISGSVSDDQAISQAHVHVYNYTTGAKLMDVHIYPNGRSATFDENFTAVSGVIYKIQVLVTDRGENQSTTTVQVSCN